MNRQGLFRKAIIIPVWRHPIRWLPVVGLRVRTTPKPTEPSGSLSHLIQQTRMSDDPKRFSNGALLREFEAFPNSQQSKPTAACRGAFGHQDGKGQLRPSTFSTPQSLVYSGYLLRNG